MISAARRRVQNLAGADVHDRPIFVDLFAPFVLFWFSVGETLLLIRQPPPLLPPPTCLSSVVSGVRPGVARKNVPLCDTQQLSWCETPLFAQGDGIPVGRAPVDTGLSTFCAKVFPSSAAAAAAGGRRRRRRAPTGGIFRTPLRAI